MIYLQVVLCLCLSNCILKIDKKKKERNVMVVLVAAIIPKGTRALRYFCIDTKY